MLRYLLTLTCSKFYLKKLFLLANSVALFTCTEAWLDVAQTPSVKYLSTSKKKKKKKKRQIMKNHRIPNLVLMEVLWLRNERTSIDNGLISTPKYIITLNWQELSLLSQPTNFSVHDHWFIINAHQLVHLVTLLYNFIYFHDSFGWGELP